MRKVQKLGGDRKRWLGTRTGNKWVAGKGHPIKSRTTREQLDWWKHVFNSLHLAE